MSRGAEPDAIELRGSIDRDNGPGAGSKTPDNSGGGAIVVLVCAQIAAVHVVSLQAPRETVERQLIVGAAAKIDSQRIIDVAAGIDVLDSGHGVGERPPLSVIGVEAGTDKSVVLRDAESSDAFAIKAAAVEHEAEVLNARKRKHFDRAVESFVALRIADVIELAIGNAGVDVSIGKQLCRHGNRQKSKSHEDQQRGSSFGHELFLPGDAAGQQNAALLNEIC
jgi:hypothetical protein